MATARRNFGAAIFTSAMLALSALAPAFDTPAQAAAAAAIAPQPPTVDEFKSTLSKFGQFIYSERYGNVWHSTSLPAGWHPYPACHWVYDRSFGWTYDDDTVWGKIVHHYGRWAHDDQAGWVWAPGTEWAPAWVIWRSGGGWTGWAHTPPNSDQQEVSLASFNADKQWTFIETAKLATRCDADPAAAPAGAFSGSAPVTVIKVVRGIAVYVLPQPATIIDYDTGPIAPWKPEFLGEWLLWLSSASAASLNVGGICMPPVSPAAAPYVSTPPPAPQPMQRNRKRRATKDAPPTRRGPQPVVVEQGPAYVEPPVYVGPPVRHRSPDWEPGPIVQDPPYVRPHPYPRPLPTATPQAYPGRPYYPRYPRRPPVPYGEPDIR